MTGPAPGTRWLRFACTPRPGRLRELGRSVAELVDVVELAAQRAPGRRLGVPEPKGVARRCTWPGQTYRRASGPGRTLALPHADTTRCPGLQADGPRGTAVRTHAAPAPAARPPTPSAATTTTTTTHTHTHTHTAHHTYTRTRWARVHCVQGSRPLRHGCEGRHVGHRGGRGEDVVHEVPAPRARLHRARHHALGVCDVGRGPHCEHGDVNGPAGRPLSLAPVPAEQTAAKPCARDACARGARRGGGTLAPVPTRVAWVTAARSAVLRAHALQGHDSLCE